MKLDDNIHIELSAEVRSLLEERGIRAEDVTAVLSFAESGKQFHTHTVSGRRLAYFTPSKVTYWLEYGPKEGGYRVYSAYSHRMKILHGYNMPSKKAQVETGWLCSACQLPLELATVKPAYLKPLPLISLPVLPASGFW